MPPHRCVSSGSDSTDNVVMAMKRKKSQKFHPRIHPANYALLRDLPPEHPVVRALQIHAEARDVCVGKELDWPHLGVVGIDQVWFSETDSKQWRFSGFAYQYISYDMVMDGWVKPNSEAIRWERSILEQTATMKALLDECELAARTDKNDAMLPLIDKAKEYVSAFECAATLCLRGFAAPQ